MIWPEYLREVFSKSLKTIEKWHLMENRESECLCGLFLKEGV